MPLKPSMKSDCYYVYQTKIKLSPLDHTQQEILDALLLAIDSFTSGCVQDARGSSYIAARLIELGKAMEK